MTHRTATPFALIATLLVGLIAPARSSAAAAAAAEHHPAGRNGERELHDSSKDEPKLARYLLAQWQAWAHRVYAVPDPAGRNAKATEDD